MNNLELKSIESLSLSNKKSLEQIVLKLSEETGELAQALLSYRSASGSEYKNLGSEDVKEECVDVVIVALSMFYKMGGTDEEFAQIFDKKVQKWQDKTLEGEKK